MSEPEVLVSDIAVDEIVKQAMEAMTEIMEAMDRRALPYMSKDGIDYLSAIVSLAPELNAMVEKARTAGPKVMKHMIECTFELKDWSAKAPRPHCVMYCPAAS